MADHNLHELAYETSALSQSIEDELVSMNRIPMCYMMTDLKPYSMLLHFSHILLYENVFRFPWLNKNEDAARQWSATQQPKYLPR